jgi:O-acetylhomoserine (thiol)-lyase
MYHKIATKIIHSKYAQPDAYGAIHLPVYRNASFEYRDSESIAAAFQHRYDQHTYSRITNPSVGYFEAKIKAASGAEHVMALASGMAAISNTFFTIAYAGCNIVSSPHLFGNTFSFFKFTLREFGIEVRFVNTDRLDEIAAAIDGNTVAFFAELITNPHLEIADLPKISEILKEKHVPMIIDTTVVPWGGYQPQTCGIDLEVVSTTKYVSGGATSIGGAIVDYGRFDWTANRKLQSLPKPKGMSRFAFKLRAEIARNMGACMAPDTAYLQSLGMETLPLRYERMSATAFRLAQHLSKTDSIQKVNYPELPETPYKPVSDSLFSCHPGALLSVTLESKEACYRFMDKLQIFRRATNMFDNKSLVIHPDSTIYGTFTKEMKELIGIQPTLVRFSIGLEAYEDLKEDIEQSLDGN